MAAGGEERKRREGKRRGGVEAVKRTDEYLNAAQPRPPTPDPTDFTVSRRKWEKGVQMWRKGLSQAAGRSGLRWQ